MKKYPKELQNVLDELHIEKISKTDEIEMILDFNVKTKKVILGCYKDCNLKEILALITDNKDYINDFYNDCIEQAKLPIKTTFEINEILGYPLEYEVDNTCDGYTATGGKNKESLVIGYKSILSNTVDKFVKDNLEELENQLKDILEIRKLLEEYSGKFMVKSNLLPNNINGIPIVYHYGEDVRRSGIEFNDKFGYFEISAIKSKGFYDLEILRLNLVGIVKDFQFKAYMIINSTNDMLFTTWDNNEFGKNLKNNKVYIFGECYKLKKESIAENDKINIEVDDKAKVFTLKYNFDAVSYTDKHKLTESDILYDSIMDYYSRLMDKELNQLSKELEEKYGLDAVDYEFDLFADGACMPDSKGEKLIFNEDLGSKPKICLQFVYTYQVLSLKYEAPNAEFYKDLTQILPKWLEGAAYCSNKTPDYLRNALGLTFMEEA